eukprot:6234026-Prymnesium_polylepis.1
MYSASASDATIERASSSASFQLAPCTVTSAPCARILSSMIGLVVVGTITRTVIPSTRPMAATAWPALPPELQMRLLTPDCFSCAHMYAIPRSLNEPLG